MPSTSDSRQPYRLSNLLLVTESLTLIAGNASAPSFAIWYRRFTPVVVSSLTPLICFRRVEYHFGSSFSLARIELNSEVSSSLPGFASTLAALSAGAAGGRKRGGAAPA